MHALSLLRTSLRTTIHLVMIGLRSHPVSIADDNEVNDEDEPLGGLGSDIVVGRSVVSISK